MCSRSLFFFTAAYFHLALVAASISHLLFLSRSRPPSPFLSLSFAGVPPTFSFSLSFSALYSKFVDVTISLN